jgi:hypothetical protein
MSISEIWLENFKAVIAEEIHNAGGKAADGYRAVAQRTGFGYDYIYQIYTGKSGKRPTFEVMQKVAKVYADGRGPEWINQISDNQAQNHPHIERPPERSYNFHKIQGLEDACNTLARYFEDMPEEDRDNAVRWLSGLVHRPSSAPHVIGALTEMVVTPRKSPAKESTRA